MTPEELAAEEAATAAAKKAEEEAKAAATEPSQIQVELVKEQNRNTRTEKEKAEFSLKKNAERLKELGGDPTEALGLKASEERDEGEVPSWYLKEKAKESQKSALELADTLEDANERDLVKSYLSKRIVPSGNAEDDFRLALGAVNALKNKQIVEELSRRVAPRVTAAGGSVPAKTEKAFEPTAEESRFMLPPYSMTKEQILAARRGEN